MVSTVPPGCVWSYKTLPDTEFIARTRLIPGINADEEHIRTVLGSFARTGT
jgi:hypothetical protein